MRKITRHSSLKHRITPSRRRGCPSVSRNASTGCERRDNPVEREDFDPPSRPEFATGSHDGRRKADRAMERDDDELDRLVLTAVSNDFESFEAIVSRIAVWNAEVLGERDTERIAWSLVRSIAANRIRAYLVHADAPYITVVGDSSDTIRRYWFYITASGLRYLRDGYRHPESIPEP